MLSDDLSFDNLFSDFDPSEEYSPETNQQIVSCIGRTMESSTKRTLLLRLSHCLRWQSLRPMQQACPPYPTCQQSHLHRIWHWSDPPVSNSNRCRTIRVSKLSRRLNHWRCPTYASFKCRRRETDRSSSLSVRWEHPQLNVNARVVQRIRKHHRSGRRWHWINSKLNMAMLT